MSENNSELKSVFLEGMSNSDSEFWDQLNSQLQDIETNDEFSDEVLYPETIKEPDPEFSYATPIEEGRAERMRKLFFTTAASTVLLVVGVFSFSYFTSNDDSNSRASNEGSSVDTSLQFEAAADSEEAADDNSALNRESNKGRTAETTIEAEAMVDTFTEDSLDFDWYRQLLDSGAKGKEFINLSSATVAANRSGTLEKNQFSVYAFDAEDAKEVIVVCSSDSNIVKFDIHSPDGQLIDQNQSIGKYKISKSGRYYLVVTVGDPELVFGEDDQVNEFQYTLSMTSS